MESRVDNRLRVQLAHCNDEAQASPRRSSQRAVLYREPRTSGRGATRGGEGGPERGREGGDASEQGGRTFPLPGGPGRPGLAWGSLGSSNTTCQDRRGPF